MYKIYLVLKVNNIHHQAIFEAIPAEHVKDNGWKPPICPVQLENIASKLGKLTEVIKMSPFHVVRIHNHDKFEAFLHMPSEDNGWRSQCQTHDGLCHL